LPIYSIYDFPITFQYISQSFSLGFFKSRSLILLLAFVPEVLWLSYLLAASTTVFFAFFEEPVYLSTVVSLISDFLIEALVADNLTSSALLLEKDSYGFILGGSFFFYASMTSQP
jgi:hypothetical protein